MDSSDNGHVFTRSEIKFAEHLFEKAIKKYFGEVWRIKSDGDYLGCSWDAKSMLAIDNGLWYLCQRVIHKGATRAAGRIETKECNTILKFIIFYNSMEKGIIQ